MNKECSSVSQHAQSHLNTRARRSAACSDLAEAVLRATDVSALAAELVSPRSLGRQLTANCPFHVDRSPSLSVNAESGKFYCFGCGAKGDIFDLAGHVWGIDGFRARVEAVARWAGVAWMLGPSGGCPTKLAHRTPPGANRLRDARKAVDRSEVAELWSHLVPVTEDNDVSEYLSIRRLDCAAIADRDVARALPRDLSLPRWAAFQRTPWSASGHRLIAQLFDCEGRLASLTARRVIDSPDDGRKALFPPGPRAGLLLADASGQWMLRAPGDSLAKEVWVAEGLTDFLALSCDISLADETAPAVLAIVGPASWSTAVAARLPERAPVVIAVDHDAAGERYAQEIIRSLSSRRTSIERWVPRTNRARP